mmetsp:Transcript_39827/g.89243  ORF Transcript_39827/g.89243 Transcript_39827/m.89243 type:complete len:150 (+) Transcript_39827:35-484(+)
MAAFGATPAMYRKSRQTGTLNLAGFDLKEIPAEILSPFDHLDEGESSQYVVLLNRLNLQDNEISVLPEAMDQIGEELNYLAMRGNLIKHIPKRLSGCGGLKQVDLSRNQISEVEAGALALPLLGDLNLANNKLAALPETLGDLRSLVKA